MIDTKYQVFISSPFKRLKEQRRAAVSSVLNWGHIPIALENFPPKTKKDTEIIKEVINDCQIYILILGHRYGTILEDYDECKDISYTELEFNIAKDSKLDILAFLLDLEEAKKEIWADNDIENKGQEFEKLRNFHDRIKKNSLAKLWYKDTNFGEICTLGIGKLLVDGVKLPGWSRSNKLQEAKKVQMALKNIFTLDMVNNLNGFRPLDERCSQDIDEKMAIAQCMKEVLLDKFISKKISIFFESGSSPAFVARELGRLEKFKNAVQETAIKLYTNNILAFLELWLNDGLPVSMLPNSTATEKYGASYGILDKHIDDKRGPNFTGKPLDQFAKDAIKDLQASSDSLPENGNIIIIGSISGVQFSDDHKIETQEGYYIDDLIVEKIKHCYGYHVGSYKDMVFKRYLMSFGYPMITTLTYRKINMSIDASRCHFLFDNEFNWPSFLKNYPIAFCVGCKQQEIKELTNLFTEQKLLMTDRFSDVKGHAALLFMNEIFLNQFYQ